MCLLPDSFLHVMTCRKLNALTAKQALALTSRQSGDGGREPAVHDLATPVPRAYPQPMRTIGNPNGASARERRHRFQIALPFDNLVFVQLRI